MRLEILGTRGHIKPSYPGHEKHAGTLVDNLILLDLGEREYLDLQAKHIFITHLHSDHAFFVDQEVEGIDAQVYAPELSAKLPKMIRIRGPVEVEGYRITPIPTIHSQTVRSLAFLIEKDLQRVLYTGDLVTIGRRYHGMIQDLDLVITDGSFYRYNGLVRRDEITHRLFGHTGIPNLVHLFSPLADKIVFSHFGSWFYRDMEQSVEKIRALSNHPEVEVAYDGMVIEI